MNKEYMVVIYDLINEYEEYEYFTNEEESIEYAKSAKDDNNITSVFLIEWNNDIETKNIIWESE